MDVNNWLRPHEYWMSTDHLTEFAKLIERARFLVVFIRRNYIQMFWSRINHKLWEQFWSETHVQLNRHICLWKAWWIQFVITCFSCNGRWWRATFVTTAPNKHQHTHRCQSVDENHPWRGWEFRIATGRVSAASLSLMHHACLILLAKQRPLSNQWEIFLSSIK